MTTLTHCLLTGYQLDSPVNVDGPIISYYHIITGKVKIDVGVAMAHQNTRNYHHPLLAGICRNAYENGEEPPEITGAFKLHEISKLDIPKSFREKMLHLLKFMHARGGNDYKPFRFNSVRDRAICYCEDHLEMNRLLDQLDSKGFIEIGHKVPMAQDMTEYVDVILTDFGIEEVEKGLPKMPMYGLVSQEIATGDSAIDEKINHAKMLFFAEPKTLDNMRSPCEALSFVLEPLKKKLTPTFADADVSAFFRMVNDFDVRHNKGYTEQLKYEEQLEWVFYTLLNSINTYYKLKAKSSL